MPSRFGATSRPRGRARCCSPATSPIRTSARRRFGVARTSSAGSTSSSTTPRFGQPSYGDPERSWYDDDRARREAPDWRSSGDGGSPYRARESTAQRESYGRSSQADGQGEGSYYRGVYRRSGGPYRYEGGGGYFVNESLTLHGPYSGKGPKGYQRRDDEICEDANQRLERHGHVDAGEIQVTCDGGVLTLKGRLADRRMKREAESCVEDIYGVKDVMNELKVDRGSRMIRGDGETQSEKAKSGKRT